MSMTSLAGLFPDEDFGFRLALRRGEPREFFRRWNPGDDLLGERNQLLAAEPKRYSALTPEGAPLLDAWMELCEQWKVLDSAETRNRTNWQTASSDEKLRELGGALEPDILLLSADQRGEFRLRGGVLCFPTGWALEEKLGHTLDSIHGVVPGLNADLGSPINQFLRKLKPGIAYLRDNWGISASDELNQHPSRRLPAPTLPVEFERLWLRVEHQALVALPRDEGVVFGIRIETLRLDELISVRGIVLGLIRALTTMPQPVAAYKRLDLVRSELIRTLRTTVT